MKAEDALDKKSEILQPLHDLVLELAEVEGQAKGHLIEYTDLDIVSASMMFVHVLSNRAAHREFNEKTHKDTERIVSEMREYGDRIGQIVHEMTGVDLNEEKESFDE